MKRKKLVGALLTAGIIFASGCSRIEESKDVSKTEQEQQQTNSQQGTEADDKTNQDNPEQADSNGISFHTYSWEEITISIPDSWEGKYRVEEGEEGFALMQTAFYKKEDGSGLLCGFYRIDGMIHDVPGVTPLAYTDTQVYYVVEPTDVSYYYEDAAISREYQEMYDLVYAVEASISIDKEGVQYNPDEFVFPMSHTIRLEDADLLTCSDNELFVARNEIYARHGRWFRDFYLSNYFDSCSWYHGTVSSDEFDETVLSQIEKDNILAIKRVEEIYKAEHPYPKEYMAGSIVEEDLDGDGRPEQLQYILEDLEYHEYSGRIIINGQEFIVEDYEDVWLDNPRLTFYVTDISPQYKGLEIAIMDNGISDDPVTYFFTYKDGVLTNIGGVGGYPFKKECGYNGFANEGAVVGEIVMGFTHTCWGFGTWRYNYEEQELEYLDTGYYINKYDYFSHQLYEDLTVYLQMDEGSLTIIIPAQERVFFMGTDYKEWVFIKGKDGSRGYVHIVDGVIEGLGKAPDEVFSGMVFSG